MPLFKCEECGCVENTALCWYWPRQAKKQSLLCSECDPDIGKWHGMFEKRTADGYATNQYGFWSAQMTNDQDLAGLSDSAPEALRRFRAQITGHPLTVGEKGAVLIALDKCADELERIARENAELCRLTDYNFACAERNGAELATLKQKIAEAPVFLCEADVISGRDYDYISAVLRHDDPAYQYPSLDGQRVAMLPVGGENGD